MVPKLDERIAEVGFSVWWYMVPSSQALALSLLFAALLILWEWQKHSSNKGELPGPQWTLPFAGCLINIILAPTRFWQKQYGYAPNGVSANSLLGRAMLFVTNSELARKIFVQCDSFQLYAHPSAKYLFGSQNMIYLSPEKHKQVRCLLQKPMFHPSALRVYLDYQIDAIRRGVNDLAMGKVVDARLAFRTVGAAASQGAFLGPYVSEEMKKELAEAVIVFTQGFLCLPVPLPGFGLYNSIKARKRLIKGVRHALECSLQESTKNLDFECRCLIDFWAKEGQVDSNNLSTLVHITLDMLFASQDATVSAMVWILHVLDTHPELQSAVKEEYRSVSQQHNTDANRIMNMKLTDHIVREILRYYPPVPMVPHVALHDIALGKDLAVKKGSVVIPSITGQVRNVSDTDTFAPLESFQRLIEQENGSYDPLFEKHLIFGAGQHKCPGRMYALQVLRVFTVMVCTTLRFSRKQASTRFQGTALDAPYKDIMFYPTMFPIDNVYQFCAVE